MELYVHFPFCRQKCRYCDFASFPGLESRMEAYVSALLREAELRAAEVREPLDTVYFGGGTPSLLPPDLLSRLLAGLKARLPLSAVSEWTSEANPGTLSADWLEAALSGGVNRLSLGMQAAQDPLLRSLGRIHDFEAVVDGVTLARKCGVRNLSLDLIFGLPGQSPADWRETLQAAFDLFPEHLSAYGLIPEEGTPLFQDLRSGKLTLPPPEVERAMYEDLLSLSALHGFEQYEISNFARPGFACRHNLGYWRQVPYLGLGVSAASLVNLRREGGGVSYLRRTNTSSFEDYLNGISAVNPVLSEKIMITPADARFETLMLGLRLNAGVPETLFESLHGVSISLAYGEKLKKLQQSGLLKHENETWSLTRLGMDLQNTALVELMD